MTDSSLMSAWPTASASGWDNDTCEPRRMRSRGERTSNPRGARCSSANAMNRSERATDLVRRRSIPASRHRATPGPTSAVDSTGGVPVRNRATAEARPASKTKANGSSLPYQPAIGLTSSGRSADT